MEEAERCNKLFEEKLMCARKIEKARRVRMLSGTHQFLYLPVQCSSLIYEDRNFGTFTGNG